MSTEPSLPAALTALRAAIGCDIALSVRHPDQATLTLGDRELRVILETTTSPPSPARLPLLRDHLRKRAETSGLRPLLLLPHASRTLAHALRAGGVCFADQTGNAWLESPGVFIWSIGNGPPPKPPARITAGPSVWQLAYILLRDTDACRLTVRELGARAGITHGTVTKAIQTLDHLGYIHNLGRKGQPIRDHERLLSGWLQGYAERLRARQFIAYARTPSTAPLTVWLERAREVLLDSSVAISGDLGAQLAGTDLIGSTAVLIVPRWDVALMRALRILPARDGNLTILQGFGNRPHHPTNPMIADPLLLLAELTLTADDRTRDAQDTLLEQIRARWSDV